MMEIDRLEIVIESESKKANAELDALTGKLRLLQSAMGGISSSVQSGFSGINKAIGNTAIAQNTLAKGTSSLGGQFNKLVTGFFALKRGLQFAMKSIKSSMDFGETVNLFQTAFRKIGLDAGEAFEYAFLERASAFNDKITGLLGLDPNEIMNYQARFAQMSNSMGLVSESAFNISSAFTMLGADISSLFNIDIDIAMKKLQSGLAGQIRPLREIGVDISKTAIMQTAYNYGIEESIEKMSAATKVQLRFLTTTQQLRIAQGDMARTLESPANQLRILRQQWDLLSRSIGNVFLPLVTKILPYLNAVVIVIRRIIQSIANLFGFEMPDYKETPIYAGEYEDIGEDLDTAGTSAENTAKALKKLKDYTLGLDEINIISPDTGSSGGDKGGGASTGAGYPKLDNEIASEWEKYQEQIDTTMETMKNKASEIADAIQKPFENILKAVGLIGIGILSWKMANSLMTALTGLGAGGKVAQGVNEIFKAFASPSGETIKLMSMLGNKTAYVGTAAVIAGIAATIAIIVVRTIDLFKNSERFRKGLAVIGKWFTDVGSWITNTAAPTIGDFFKNIIPPDVLKSITKFFKPLQKALGDLDIGLTDIVLLIGGIALMFTPAAPFALAVLIFEALSIGIRGVGFAFSDIVEPVEVFQEDISELTATKVKPFTEQMRALDDTIVGIDWTDKIIDQALVDDVGTKVKAIANTIIGELDADKNEALKTLAPLKKALGEEAYNDLISDNEKYYAGVTAKVQAGEASINKIMATAKKENRTLTDSEAKEIKRIQADMMDTGVKHLSETEIEYQTIMNRMKDNSTRVSLEQASKIIKNAQKTRDDTVSAAETQYAKVQLEAQRMLDVGAISKVEYDKVIKAAKDTRDDTIKAAEKQYQSIYNTTTTKLGETAKYIDETSGEIKTKWQVWTEDISKNFTKWWGDLKQGFKDTWTNVKKGVTTFFTKTLPEFFTVEIPKVIKQVVDFFAELPTKIGTELGKIAGTIATWVVNAVTWVGEQVPNIITAVTDFFKELPNKIKEKIDLFKTTIVNWVKDCKTWVKENVPGIINSIVDWFKKLPTALYDIGKNLIKGLWNGILSVGSWLMDKFSKFFGGIWDVVSDFFVGFGQGVEATYDPIPKYASGGIPNYGQLFIAREAGAEMVGGFGRKTAVANNDQIVSGISQGVYNAVIAAQSANASGGSDDVPLEIKVYLDGNIIGTTADTWQRNRGFNVNKGVYANAY